MGGLLIAQYISFFVSEHAAVYCVICHNFRMFKGSKLK